MLEKDTEKRLSSKEVLQTLNDELKQEDQQAQLIDEREEIKWKDFK